MTKKTKFFVDNKEFLEELEKFKENKEISDNLAAIYIKMVENLLYSRQFINYSEDWKAEMKSDAIYNCVRYTKSFNTEKGMNPFAYYTRTIINAFIMRIKKEKTNDMREDKIRKEAYTEFLNEYGLSDSTNFDEDNDYNNE